MEQREKFASRLGFILVSAGCAIGLGNVWRFPYITGKYGGAFFVLIYLFFLVALGIPVMTMEFAVGRASGRSVATAFKKLKPESPGWSVFSYIFMGGNYLLMMFYTVITGWILRYVYLMFRGEFAGMSADEVGGVFGGMLESASTNVIWMIVACAIGFGICAIGLKDGVEKVTKWMMSSLLVLMLILVIRAVTLPGASAGLAFYLAPNAEAFSSYPLTEIIFAAMGQAFFTLSLGVGSMEIFGSYIEKDNTLLKESVTVISLDTAVAFLAGLIIFPSCFAFGVEPGSGPGLVFVTLPNIFNAMPMGRLFGILFFVLMAFAAISTVVAVFENIIAFAYDLFGTPRRKAVIMNFFAIIILALPCALGFNVLSGFAPMGEGTVVLDLEDFIMSNNLLPLGSLVFAVFCVWKFGWGFDKYIEETNTGVGAKMPKGIKLYLQFVLPILMLFVFVMGYISIFG